MEARAFIRKIHMNYFKILFAMEVAYPIFLIYGKIKAGKSLLLRSDLIWIEQFCPFSL